MGDLTLAAVLTSFSLASLEATPLLCSSLDVCYEVRQSEICEDPSFGYWLKPLRQLAGCGDDTNWRAFKIFDQRGCGRLFFNGLGGAIWTTNSWAFRHFHRLDEYRYRQRRGASGKLDHSAITIVWQDTAYQPTNWRTSELDRKIRGLAKCFPNALSPLQLPRRQFSLLSARCPVSLLQRPLSRFSLLQFRLRRNPLRRISQRRPIQTSSSMVLRSARRSTPRRTPQSATPATPATTTPALLGASGATRKPASLAPRRSGCRSSARGTMPQSRSLKPSTQRSFGKATLNMKFNVCRAISVSRRESSPWISPPEAAPSSPSGALSP